MESKLPSYRSVLPVSQAFIASLRTASQNGEKIQKEIIYRMGSVSANMALQLSIGFQSRLIIDGSVLYGSDSKTVKILGSISLNIGARVLESISFALAQQEH